MNNEIKEILKFDHFNSLQDLLDNIDLWYQEDDVFYDRWFGLNDLKKLKDLITNLQEENERLKEWKEYLLNENIELESIRKEAIEYIHKCRDYHRTYHNEDKMFADELTSLSMILQGSDDNG